MLISLLESNRDYLNGFSRVGDKKVTCLKESGLPILILELFDVRPTGLALCSGSVSFF